MAFGFMPSARNVSTSSFGAAGSIPMRSDASLRLRSNWNGMVTVLESFSSTPCSTLNTIAQSSTVRHMGPTRSIDHDSTMPPWRLTRPYVGRSALMPLRMAGDTIEPCVSVPIENATQPAAVAEPGPVELPLEPMFVFHGLFVRPPNHQSFCANNPVANFASNTAPASRKRTTTSESLSGI